MSTTSTPLTSPAPSGPVALLSIGTELTRGELVNRNATWLAERLISLGYEVNEVCTIDDDDERIISTLRRLASTHAAIVSTGGLGPTSDDRTTACAAALLGLPLQRDEQSLARIHEIFARYDRQPSPSNEKQADFPQGATVLDNHQGTAPGFFVDIPPDKQIPSISAQAPTTCRAFFLPGVPREMEDIFNQSVVPALPAPATRLRVARLRSYGLPESEVGERLSDLEESEQITLGYRASNSEIEVKILNPERPGEDTAAADARTARVVAEVKQRLGNAVYAEGTDSLPAVIGRLLEKNQLTLGLAESCTGGLVSQLVTNTPGSSAYYLGGICSYANSVKTAVLGVSEETLNSEGAVSKDAAVQMARGAQRALGADVALALTGVAGPDGGTEEKPVGLVHWAVATPDWVLAYQRVFRGDRAGIRQRAAVAGLWSLHNTLIEW